MGGLWAVSGAGFSGPPQSPLGKQKGGPRLDNHLPKVTSGPHVQGHCKGLPEGQASNISPFSPRF